MCSELQIKIRNTTYGVYYYLPVTHLFPIRNTAFSEVVLYDYMNIVCTNCINIGLSFYEVFATTH